MGARCQGEAVESRDHAAVSECIQALYPTLSPRLRQAARYLLDCPDDVALQSMRRLAANAGVNPATMVRLAKALDYPGFEALREPFRERLRRPDTGYSMRAKALQARGKGEAQDPYRPLLAEMLDADLGNLRRTFETVGFDRLVDAGRILGGARRIYVAGLRSCYPVAFYFHYASRMFIDTVRLLEGPGGSFADGLRGAGKSDAMLAISLQPYTKETVGVVNYAVEQGASVVAITDSPVSPLATVAKVPLVVACASPSFFQSLVAAMAVAQALVAILIARGGAAALDELKECEALLGDFQAYWQPGSPRMAVRSSAGGQRA